MDDIDEYDFNDLMEVIEDKFKEEIDRYVEDHLDDVDDDALVKELEFRHYFVIDEYNGKLDESDVDNTFKVHINYTKEELREHLLLLLGMGHHHSNEDISRRVMEELG